MRTNVSVTRIPIGKGDLYFCPDTILVYAAGGVGAVGYDELQFECVSTRFIEDGTVPRDAKVVDRTWRFVNKKGGPDRRFKDNRELPICEYEEIRLRTSSGLNEILQVSRVGLGHRIEHAAKRMATALAAARQARLGHMPSADTNHQDPPSIPSPCPPISSSAPPTFPSPVKPAEMVPTIGELHTALFRLLCCVMVADGRASSTEKSRIEELMQRAGAAWDSEQTSLRINEFIADVQKVGFKATFEQALSRAPLFSMIGRQDILMKALRTLAQAKDGISAPEHAMFARIEASLRLTDD